VEFLRIAFPLSINENIKNLLPAQTRKVPAKALYMNIYALFSAKK
jgi:hypothetical protein